MLTRIHDTGLLLLEAERQLVEIEQRESDATEMLTTLVQEQDAAVALLMKDRAVDERRARGCLENLGWDVELALDKLMPHVPASPVWGRTFSSSNFKAAYDRAAVPKGPMEIGAILQELIKACCKKDGIDWISEGMPFFKQLQTEAMEAMDNALEVVCDIPAAAQQLWTSALTLRGHGFCHIVNTMTRADEYELCENLAMLARAINEPRVGIHAGSDPINAVCFRGGGFNERFRSFFATTRTFRQPTFLATSLSIDVAESFMRRSPEATKILWLIRIDPARKCLHANLVQQSNALGEAEYLFAPYSVFTVLHANWNAGTDSEPHVVELMAAVDNKVEAEDLPLAPWS